MSRFGLLSDVSVMFGLVGEVIVAIQQRVDNSLAVSTALDYSFVVQTVGLLLSVVACVVMFIEFYFLVGSGRLAGRSSQNDYIASEATATNDTTTRAATDAE